MDVGGLLRRAREQRRLTLADLARSTKIPVSTLLALENNDVERLPAAVYTRSFVRQYAHQVGLEPAAIVEEYMEQLAAAAAVATAEPPPTVPARALSSGIGANRTRTILNNPRRLPLPALAASAIVLAIVGYVSWSSRSGDGNDIAVAQAAAPDLASSSLPATPDAARASNALPEYLRLELKVTGPCWVSATADHMPALARLLQAGDHQEIEVRDELVLRVGDPSTVNMSINGMPLRRLGPAGQAVTVEITKQNYRELLAS